MGEGQSKARGQTSNQTSLATGDIKPAELNALHNRCLPKGLKGENKVPVGGSKQVADAPVAAPAAAPGVAPVAGQPILDMANAMAADNQQQQNIFWTGAGIMPGALQRSPSMIRTAQMADGYNFQRSPSMVRTSAQMPAVPATSGSLIVPAGNFQRSDSMIRAVVPANFQRSDSLIRSSAQHAAVVQPNFQRSDSLIRSSVQHTAVINQGNFQRSDSMIRASAQPQQAPGSTVVPAGAFQRAPSIVRASYQQEAPQAQTAPQPRSKDWSQLLAASPGNMQRASSLIRTSEQQQAIMSQVQQEAAHQQAIMSQMQQEASVVAPPAGSVRMTMQSPFVFQQQPAQNNLLASQKAHPTTQAPSTVPMPPSTVPAKVLSGGVRPTTQAPSVVPAQMQAGPPQMRAAMPPQMQAGPPQMQAALQAPQRMDTTALPPQAQTDGSTVRYVLHTPHTPRGERPGQHQIRQPRTSVASSTAKYNPEVRAPRTSIASQPRERSPEPPAQFQNMRARDVYAQMRS